PAHRARLSPHSDFDRAFANVPWCALSFGRCLRGNPRHCLRCRRLAVFPVTSAVGYFKNRRERAGAGTGTLRRGAVRFELTTREIHLNLTTFPCKQTLKNILDCRRTATTASVSLFMLMKS